jgi:hypothetical protein
VSESDLGNVGVQRAVSSYEHVERFLDPPGGQWLAVLSCGHTRKLSAEPGRGAGPAASGRYMDCEDCTRLARAEGA